MTSTTFIDKSQATPIVAAWLNDVNNTVYTALGSGGVAPTTAAIVRTNLDLPTNTALAGSTGSSLIGFLQAGTSAVSETVQAKLRQMVSVKDFGAVGDNTADDTTAIAAAIATGKAVYFPDGNYKTTSSLLNFHSTLKAGPGYVFRGGSSFAITPKSTDTNIISVTTTGSDTNDGLGASQAFLTLQAAVNSLANYGPYLQGQWNVNLSAGTYAAGATFPFGLTGVNRIQINGVTGGLPFTPTVIIGPAAPGVGNGFVMNGGNNVIINNIKFQNFQNSGLAMGVVCQDLCELYLNNCYFNACDNAIKSQQSRLYVLGGIITGGTVGITSISNNTHTIGYTATLAGTTGGTGMGTYINGCSQAGILIQENSTGHADFCTINNCAVGADVVSSSRVHANGSVFTNNVTAGVRSRASSWWFNNNSVFTTNGVNWLNYASTQELGNYGTAVAEIRSAYDGAAVTHTGDTTETVIKASIGLGVLDNTLIWTGKCLRFRIYGSFAGGVGTKTLRIKIGGSIISGVTSVVSSTAQFQWEVRVNAVSSSAQRVTSFLLDNTANPSVVSTVTTGSINMATGSTQTISLTGQLSNAADTYTVNEVEMWETA